MVARANSSNVGVVGTAGAPYLLAQSAIPIIKAPTGTMGNNGAVTLGTALPSIYAKGYIQLPAGAIATSVPAASAIYYVEMSSTTVGIVYNNLLSANVNAAGEPQIPAVKTAFVTTGPGAFTGSIAAETFLTNAVGASVLGLNGKITSELLWSVNNTAGVKTAALTFGGQSINNPSLASATVGRQYAFIQNRGEAAIQIKDMETFIGGSTVLMTAAAVITVDTAVAQNLVVSATTSTAATDYMVLERFSYSITKPT